MPTPCPLVSVIERDVEVCVCRNPDKRIQNFYEIDYDSGNWADMPVPSHWRLQGYDYPQYTNVRYPWSESEPELKAPSRQRDTIP